MKKLILLLPFFFLYLNSSVGNNTSHCSSSGNFPWHDWIAHVSIAGLVNDSGKSPCSDFTSQVAYLESGSTIDISLAAGFSYFSWDEYWTIWIDYNQNGVFEENSETAFQGILTAKPDGTPAAFFNGTIQIPADALAGNTRMRVSMKRHSYATPCEVFPFGEVEDYTINISSPSPDYCAASSAFPWHDWIANVQIAGYNFPSGKSEYSDFSNSPIEVNAGELLNVTLTSGYSYFTYDEHWSIFIDYNNNGEFDGFEGIALSVTGTAPPDGTTTGIAEGVINIPLVPVSFQTRMRVVMSRAYNNDACGVIEYGEVEDYTIFIKKLEDNFCGFEQTYDASTGYTGVSAKSVPEGLCIRGHSSTGLNQPISCITLLTDDAGNMTNFQINELEEPSLWLDDDNVLSPNLVYVSIVDDVFFKVEVKDIYGYTILENLYEIPAASTLHFMDVLENENGGLAVFGKRDFMGTEDMVILELDSDGNQLSLNFSDYVFTSVLGQTPDGGFWGSKIVYAGSPEIWFEFVAKVAANGTLMLEEEIGSVTVGLGGIGVVGSAVNEDGSILLAVVIEPPFGPSTISFSLMDSEGNIQGFDFFAVLPDDSEANPQNAYFDPYVTAMPDGGWGIAYRVRFFYDSGDILVFGKFDKEGNLLWKQHLTNPDWPISSIHGVDDGSIVCLGEMEDQIWMAKVNPTENCATENRNTLAADFFQQDSYRILLFPNPADDVLFISPEATPKPGTTWRILNAQGQVLQSGTFTLTQGATSQVDVSTLLGGMYYFNITNRTQKSTTKKFIIARN